MGNLVWPQWRAIACVLLSGALSACGGGGSSAGGTGYTNPPAKLIVSPSSLNVTADTSQQGASASLVVTVQTNDVNGVFVFASTTNSGISALNPTPDSNVVMVGVTFFAPNAVGVGTYNDTITFKACYDQACTQPISNSPLTVPVTYTVTQAVPYIAYISPRSASAGAPGVSLSVQAGNIDSTSQVLWNGSPRPTAYDPTSNTLDAQISAADIAVPGTASVQVQTGNVQSAPNSYTITPPQITQIAPTSAAAGTPSFTLTVNGGYFQTGAQVLWNGSPRATTVMSSTQLTAQITAADVAIGGTASVQVQTGGLQTTGVAFTTAPLAALTFTQVSPAQVSAGGTGFHVDAIGTGFATTSIITWNGAELPTTYVSSKLLRAQVSANLIASAGTVSLAIVNPAAQGGSSGTRTLNIVAATKDATSYQIEPGHSGAASFADLALPSASAWSTDVGGTPSYAVIAGGRVFVTVSTATGSAVLALDAATGANVWGPLTLTGAANLAYENDQLFVTSANANLQYVQALDPATGAIVWSLNTPTFGRPAPPVARGGIVYVITSGVVSGIDETSGTILWSADTPGSSGTIAVSSDGVYATSSCNVVDLEPSVGNVLWNYVSGCSGSGGGTTPVVANGSVSWLARLGLSEGIALDAESGVVQGNFIANQIPAYSATTGFFMNSGTLQGRLLSNHQVLWSFTGDGQLSGAPIVVNGYVFIGSAGGNLYALDAASGAQVWTQALGAAVPATALQAPPTMYTGLSAGDGLLVVPNGTRVTAFTLSTSP